jgi:predicted nuclease of restriction endonuclease-like (RecB) superfamily
MTGGELMSTTRLASAEGYEGFLKDLKERIRTAQVRAALAVNRELVLLYWSMGRDILSRQKQHGWGAKIIDRLAADLHKAFPEITGLSPRNLKYMRAFAEAWPDEQIVQAALAQITWYHNIALVEKLNTPEERLWYARQTIQNGWSRNVLVHHIESGLYRRQGKALTNFTRTLPAPQSELAQQIVKDPYNFEFLTIAEEARERELERALIDHIRDFLLELGVGFAFVGSQYPIQVGGEEFRLDLLFYHLRLRAFIVLDLKIGQFQPEFSGKMNFYLSAIDDLLRHPDDQPSIGIILCKSKNKVVAEYALRDIRKPVGVSEYRLTEALPKRLRGSLPAIEQLEAELKQEVQGNT